MEEEKEAVQLIKDRVHLKKNEKMYRLLILHSQ